MAHKDYSGICQPFQEGVENELKIKNIRASACVSVCYGYIPAGREIIILDAYALAGHRTTACLSTTASCGIGIFKNTLSTQVGSILLTQSAFASSTADFLKTCVIGSCTTSVAFTSTDVICVAVTESATGTDTIHRIDVVLRYRDK